MDFELYFPLFDKILQGNLNPSLEINAEGVGYHTRIQEMIFVPAEDTGIYKSVYLAPFSFKTRYYHKLLSAEVYAYIAEMQEITGNETDSRVKAFLRNQLLDKHLTTCLKRLGEYCRERNYRLQKIVTPDTQTDNNHLSDIWIFHFLKVMLAKAYLEIQFMLKDVVHSNYNEEQLYVTLFGETLPVQRWLKKIPLKASAKQEGPLKSTVKSVERDVFDIRNYYNKSEFCELWDVSDSTFERRSKEMDFPTAKKHKNRNYYLKTEADKWIAKNKK